MNKNLKKTKEAKYVWDLNKLKRLAQIVKKNEDKAKEIEAKEDKIKLEPRECQN